MNILYIFAQRLSNNYLPDPSESINDIINVIFAILGAIGVDGCICWGSANTI